MDFSNEWLLDFVICSFNLDYLIVYNTSSQGFLSISLHFIYFFGFTYQLLLILGSFMGLHSL